jgi:hypothetical protein
MPRPMQRAVRDHLRLPIARPGPASLATTARNLGISTETLIAYLQANGGLPERTLSSGIAFMRNMDTKT